MARVRGILDRLRPAGAPGAAARAGVPVDRREGLDRELAPVFTHLEPVLRECARLRQEAMAAAQQREAEAARRADEIVAGARAQSETERSAAAAVAQARAAAETRRIEAGARAEAERIRSRGERRRAQLVARVLDLVRADVWALADDGVGQGAADARFSAGAAS